MARRLLITTLLVLALAPSAAMAADSHAPKGARGDWLPTSEWVMSSWLPVDEARLYHLLGTNRGELATWLNDERTLGQFAAEHGFTNQRALADALVAPRLKTASAALRRTLRSILVRRNDQAVRIGAMSRRQADALLAHQDAGLDAYMTRRYRTPAQQVTFVCRPH